ncbi:unnamed protein product [Citrullus colocynthis]|uniref:Uncharacterized protein n=1 Tax=Citrullus colocynthis TaxID=252529 RepID=A0ABP0Y3V6_9ROSI
MAIRQHSPLELEPWNDLNGKVMMVTGASAGLGREFCLDLARAGCKIIVAARRIDRLQSLCDEINQLKFSISSSVFTSPISPMVGVEGRRAVVVELDVCANEKSIGGERSVKCPLELSEEEWDHTMGTNLKGPWLVSKYVCILMNKANRGGSIINISSASGLNRALQTGALAYITSKAAVNTLTKVMAMELGGNKIRVNSICPGIFKSEITKDLMEKDWIKNVAMKVIPLRTFGTSDPALTTVVRYLSHDSSKYVSGNIFIVEAGHSLPGVPIFSSL